MRLGLGVSPQKEDSVLTDLSRERAGRRRGGVLDSPPNNKSNPVPSDGDASGKFEAPLFWFSLGFGYRLVGLEKGESGT